MADDQAKTGFEEDENPEKGGKDYASKMWKKIEKIEQKSALKQERNQLKGEIPEKGESFDKPKRRRRRRRKKGGGERGPEQKVEQRKTNVKEVKHEVKSEVKPEVGTEAKPEIKPEMKPEAKNEPMPPATPVMPINPFATSQPTMPSVTNLPGQTVSGPKVPEPKVSEPVEPAEPLSSPAASPINPFAGPAQPQSAPLTDKYPEAKLEDEFNPPKQEEQAGKDEKAPVNPFDRFPMEPADEGDEDVEDVDLQPNVPPPFPVNPFDAHKEPESVSLHDLKESEELPVNGVEDVSQDSYAEEDQSQEMEKQERNIIDVESEEAEFAGAQEFPAASAEGASEDDFKEEFWDILEQAGITKKRIVTFFIALVVVVLGLILFFGFYGGGDDGSKETTEEESEESGEVPPVADDDKSQIGEISGFTAAKIIGFQYNKTAGTKTFDVKTPLNTTFVFGKLSEVKREGFVGHVDLLRRMENLYNTDIYNIVNLSLDRRKTLNDFLVEMDSAINEGLIAYNLLEQQLLALDAEYSRITEQRDLYEAGFFADLDAFRGQDAYSKMTLFVQFSQTALEVKADYNAKKTIRDKLVLSLNALRPRYDDILTNSEAIIKGVKVFDLPDSDIDAIVPVE